MCEDAYIGCPNCGEPAQGDVRQRTLQTEVIKYHLNDCGDATADEPDYDGEVDTADDGYECACGWYGSELDYECTSEDCECDECVEPEPDEEGPDPDRIVSLRRATAYKPTIHAADWPKELIQLANDRTIDRLPMPRWRACEIFNEHLEGTDFDVDFSAPHPQMIVDLMHDYSDQREPTKEAKDEHVAACA